VGDVTLTCASGSCHACICDGSVIASSSQVCRHEQLYISSYFFLLLSLFWTSTICANIVHCSVSYAVAHWWSNANPPSQAIVWQGFTTAVTRSFGSICLGSLIVAIIRTMRATVAGCQKLLSQVKLSSSMLRCMLEAMSTVLIYVLSILDKLVEYFNLYAFCFVAIYGYSFVDASKAAIGLFRDRGWYALINEDILAYVFFLSHILVGLLCSLCAFSYISTRNISSVNATLVMVLAYNVGHLMCCVTTNLIASAVATIFVCFAEKADYFQITHPELFVELLDAWTAFYPDTVPSVDKDMNKGSYVPPHLLTAKDTQATAYQPVFTRGDGAEDIDDLEMPRRVARSKQASSTKKGIVISGKFAESPYTSPRSAVAAPSQQLDFPSSKPAGDGLIAKVISGAKEHSSRLYDQMTAYMTPAPAPVYRRDHHFIRSEGTEQRMNSMTNMDEHPQIYDNADESTMF
jgi:hypothetical protein